MRLAINTFVVDFKSYIDKLLEVRMEENCKKYGAIVAMRKQNPKRIFGMISLNPHLKEKEFKEEVTRWVQKLRFVGIKY